MKKAVFRIFSTLLAILMVASLPYAHAASGVTYYVSGSALASDENNGTSPQTPFRTMDAINKIQYFPAGSKILFEGGYRYGGNLLLTTNGSANAPVEITSYGAGVATLTDEGANKGTPTAPTAILQCWNAQYTNIHDLQFEGTAGINYGTGNFVAGNYCWAIMLAAGNHEASKLGWLTVSNVSITNTFGGIEVVSNTDTTGYNGINITHCHLVDVAQYGIFVIGKDAFNGGETEQFNDVHIRYNTITDMHGDPYYKAEVQPICIASGTYLYIEHNAIKRAGGCGGLKAGENEVGGSTGIGVNNCRNFSVLHNEITGMNSNTNADASAIDVDQDSQNGEVAFNLTYNNRGPSVQIGSFGGKTTGWVDIHHNVSYNDAQGIRDRSEQGALRFFGNTTNINVFNNSIYIMTWLCGTPSCVNFERHPSSTDGNVNINFFNNIFRMAKKGDTMPCLIRSNRYVLQSSIAPSVKFFNNAYSSGQAQITICNDPLTGNGIDKVTDSYTGSLYDWQQLGQEMDGDVRVGVCAPDLGIPCPDTLPDLLTDLTPALTSPCVDAAVDPWGLALNSKNKTDILGSSAAINTIGAITVRTTFTVSAAATIRNGSVSGTGIYRYGDTATVTFVPNQFFKLALASLNGEVQTVTDNTLSFTVTGDTVVGATFTEYNLQDFINNAGGQPVYLNNNFDVRSLDGLYIPAGETLDLNGCKVYTNALICHGTIRDSKNGQGIIVCGNTDDAHFEVTANNGQMPLYDNTGTEKGYRFFDFALINRGARVVGETVKFGTQVDFTNANAYALLQKQPNLDVALTVDLMAADGRTAQIPYVFTDEILTQYGQARQNGTGNVIVIACYNIAPGLTIQTTPQLISGTNATSVGQSVSYTLPQ